MSTKHVIRSVETEGEFSRVYEEFFEFDKIFLETRGLEFSATTAQGGAVTIIMSRQHAAELGLLPESGCR